MARENYYILLGLDPDRDSTWAAIEPKVRAKRNEWSQQGTTHPTRKYEFRQYLTSVPDIERVLKDDTLRAQEADEARKLIQERQASAQADLESKLQVTAAKGYLTPEDIRSLVGLGGGRWKEADVRAVAGKLKVSIQAASSSSKSGSKSRPRLDSVIEGAIQKNLQFLKRADLYEFLEAERTMSAKALRDLADKKYEEARNLPETPEVRATRELIGQCLKLFTSEPERAKYDNTLQWLEFEQIRNLAEAAGAGEGKIAAKVTEELIRRGKKDSIPQEEVIAAITEVATRRKWLVEVPSSSMVKDDAVRMQKTDAARMVIHCDKKDNIPQEEIIKPDDGSNVVSIKIALDGGNLELRLDNLDLRLDVRAVAGKRRLSIRAASSALKSDSKSQPRHNSVTAEGVTSSDIVFGIDLGTTFSAIAYVDEFGQPRVCWNMENTAVTPSVVYFESPQNVIVGQAARESGRIDPQNYVELIKRSMGDKDYRRTIHGQDYRPEQLSAFVLKKLKEDTEALLGTPVTDAVITVPAYFNEAQRTATEQAGIIAGLNVRGIIPEPVAAAAAYSTAGSDSQTLLVFDLGGGTFDVTVMQVTGSKLQVMCIDGDNCLGGRNWDDRVVAYLAEEWKAQTGSSDDPLDDLETFQELCKQAEEAKRLLTHRQKTVMKVRHAGQSVRVELTREQFDSLTADLLERTVTLTRQALAEAARQGVAKIDKILLVGGSSYMPQVQSRLQSEFAGVEQQLFEPEQAVAKGAAIYAANRKIQDACEACWCDRQRESMIVRIC